MVREAGWSIVAKNRAWLVGGGCVCGSVQDPEHEGEDACGRWG